MRHEINALALTVDGVAPTITTGAITGAAIDRQGFDSLSLHASMPQLSGANTCPVKIQESTDGASGWTDVAGSTLTLDATTNAGNVGVRLTGCQRYIRVAATVPAETGPTFAAVVVLGGAHETPVQ